MEEEGESDSPRWWFYASIATILISGGVVLAYLWVSAYGFPQWQSSPSLAVADASQGVKSQRVAEEKKVQEPEEAVEESKKLQEEALQKEELKRQEEQRRQEEQQRQQEEQRRQEGQRQRQEEERKLREKEAAVHEEMVHFTLWSGGDPPWEIAMWIREDDDGSVGGSLALYKQGDMREITGQWDGMTGNLHFSPGAIPQLGDADAVGEVVERDDGSWLVLDGAFHREYHRGKEDEKFKRELGLVYQKRMRAADIGDPAVFNAMWTETAEWRTGQDNLFVALATGGEGFPNFICLNVVGSVEARTKEQYQVNVRSVQSLGGMGMISINSLGTAADVTEQRQKELTGQTISRPAGKVLLLPKDFISLEQVVALDTDNTTTLRALNAGYKVFEKAFDLALSKGLGSAPGRESSGREERRGSSSAASQPSVIPPPQSAVTLSGTVLFKDEKTGSYKPRGGVIVTVDFADFIGDLISPATHMETDARGRFSMRIARGSSYGVWIKKLREGAIWEGKVDRDTTLEIQVNRNIINVRQR